MELKHTIETDELIDKQCKYIGPFANSKQNKQSNNNEKPFKYRATQAHRRCSTVCRKQPHTPNLAS